jgi:uncharacterized protein
MSSGILFEWDPAKAEANLKKHGVAFEDAVRVFADPARVSDVERIENGEARWQSIGMVDGIRLLLVARTWHDDSGVEIIRIISARKAERHERRRYEN